MLSSCEKMVAGATISSTINEWSQNLMEKPSQEQQQALKCPRCDSTNTKFCYYNNYSLSQPRHFCKSCKRYWTRGGTLRNVPVGGGCRKNKRVKRPTSSSSSSPLSSTSSTHHVNNNNNNNNNPLFYGLANDASADIINFPYQPCPSDFPNNPLLSSYSNMFGFSSSSTPNIASLLASTLNQHKIINGGVKNTEPLALPPFLDQLEQIGLSDPAAYWSTNMGSWHDPTSIGFGSSVTSLI